MTVAGNGFDTVAVQIEDERLVANKLIGAVAVEPEPVIIFMLFIP